MEKPSACICRESHGGAKVRISIGLYYGGDMDGISLNINQKPNGCSCPTLLTIRNQFSVPQTFLGLGDFFRIIEKKAMMKILGIPGDLIVTVEFIYYFRGAVSF